MRKRLLVPVLLAVAACGPPPADRQPVQSTAPASGVASAERGTLDRPDGSTVAYSIRGQGDPTVVLVHCWMCDSTYWVHQVGLLAASRRVVTLDLPGHGLSRAGERNWTISSYGADVAALVRHLDLDKVVLIGHSMGGPVALDAAARLGDRVVAVIGVDTFHNADSEPPAEQMEQLLAAYEADFAGTTHAMVEQLFPPGAEPALIERIATDMAAGPAEIGSALMRDFWHYDLRRALRAVHCPVRTINAGLFEERMDPEANRRYAPDFEQVVLPDAGHFLQLEKPEAFNRLLVEQLERIGA